tara:strand:+ start:1340 stop:1681 length:342 start_codon:yes stop_codon:yes gene_type:complete
MAAQPLPKSIRELCTPAALYFILSFVSIIIMSIQNLGNTTEYCLGNYKCDVPSTIIVFVIKAIYVLFFTWVLNLICNAGYKGVSWFLVLFPFIMFFIILGISMLYLGAEQILM